MYLLKNTSNKNRMNFYKTIYEMEKNKRNISAVKISGKDIGEKAVWSDEKIIFCSGGTEFWKAIERQILKRRECGIIKIENEEIYIEIIQNEPEIIICGAGHVSIPIIKISRILGFKVNVIEDREEFIEEARSAGADKIICDSYKKALQEIRGEKNYYYIIVTRGHKFDQLCLENILEKEKAYVGMIGSKTRVTKIFESMIKKGFSEESLKKVHSPIGLRINAETPEEVALSILSEIVMIRNENEKGSYYEKKVLKELCNGKEDKAVVTIVERSGSAPRGVGAKMVVSKEGLLAGTIGGGLVEAYLIKKAKEFMTTNTSKVLRYEMTGTEVEDEGMICGGTVRIFVDVN